MGLNSGEHQQKLVLIYIWQDLVFVQDWTTVFMFHYQNGARAVQNLVKYHSFLHQEQNFSVILISKNFQFSLIKFFLFYL